MANTPPKQFQEPSQADKARMIAARRQKIVQDKLISMATLAGKNQKK